MTVATARIVVPMERSLAPAAAPRLALDEESRAWLRELRAEGAAREAAVARLHGLLLRAAKFEVARRRPAMRSLRGDELDDIAMEAADDALMSVLRRLDDFRGTSRFTTWAYKFALLEAAVRLRSASGRVVSCRSSPRGGTRSPAPPSARAPRPSRPSSSPSSVVRSTRS